jgi:hypothetical protein
LHSGQLTLEVGEEAVVEPEASSDLKTLSEMGVQLSIDDVGTNWSSFEPFQRHAISTVKIDGSFVSGLEPAQGINRLVVETVIHMAHSLGMSAVVECVETADQVATVRKFDADAAQGFFFARPMRGEQVEALAGRTDIPRFSLTETRTLLFPDEQVLVLDGFLESEPPSPEEYRAQEEGATPKAPAEAAAEPEDAADVEEPPVDAPPTPKKKSAPRAGKASAATEKSAAPRGRSGSTPRNGTASTSKGGTARTPRAGSASTTRKPRRTTKRT